MGIDVYPVRPDKSTQSDPGGGRVVHGKAAGSSYGSDGRNAGGVGFLHQLEGDAAAEQQDPAVKRLTGEKRVAFGLTEPNHGSDATWLETTATRDGDDWILSGSKRFNTGLHSATHDLIFARSSGKQGEARGITCLYKIILNIKVN